MQTLFFTLLAFVAIIVLMSVGFIFKKQALKGSCGGLSSLGIAKACDCDKPCDTLQEKLDAGDENAKAEYENSMPYVNIKVTGGAEAPTAKQKAELIEGVTHLLQKVLNKNPETTVVVIDEVDMDNWGIGGKTVTSRRSMK